MEVFFADFTGRFVGVNNFDHFLIGIKKIRNIRDVRRTGDPKNSTAVPGILKMVKAL